MKKLFQKNRNNVAPFGRSNFAASLPAWPAGRRLGLAETLLEAIIAISIFVTIVGPASAIYVSSIRTIATNRNDLVAAALAEEGVEVVRNMRDTNLLRFSPKAQACWNAKREHTTLGDEAIDPDACDNPNNKIGDEAATVGTQQHFRLTLNTDDLSWKLVEPLPSDAYLSDPFATPPVVDESDIEQYRLSEDVVTPGINEECTAPNTPEHCSYHTGLYFAPETLPGAGDIPRGRESIFYRQITIEYLNLDSDPEPEPVMRVTSLVQYRAGVRLRNIKRALILTNQPI